MNILVVVGKWCILNLLRGKGVPGGRFAQAVLVSDLLPLWMRSAPVPDHQWFWNGHEHVDPAKEANAQATRLANHTTTLAHEYAKQGRDWESELRQRAKERRLMDELGLTTAENLPTEEATEDEEEEVARKAA